MPVRKIKAHADARAEIRNKRRPRFLWAATTVRSWDPAVPTPNGVSTSPWVRRLLRATAAARAHVSSPETLTRIEGEEGNQRGWRSYARRRADVTFAVAEADVPGRLTDDRATPIPLRRQLIESLQAIPGVDAVAVANQLPLDGCCPGTNSYPEATPAGLMAGQRTTSWP